MIDDLLPLFLSLLEDKYPEVRLNWCSISKLDQVGC